MRMEQAMETILQLSEDAIRARFDAQSWQCGRQYARDGSIVNAHRQGMREKYRTLRALKEEMTTAGLLD